MEKKMKVVCGTCGCVLSETINLSDFNLSDEEDKALVKSLNSPRRKD